MPYANTPAGRKKRIEDKAKKTGNLFTAADEVAREDALERLKAETRERNKKIIDEHKKTNPIQEEKTTIRTPDSTITPTTPTTPNTQEYYDSLSSRREYKTIARTPNDSPATKRLNKEIDIFGGYSRKYMDHAFETMLPRELDNYNYLYGKYGLEEAEQYAEYMDDELKLRKAALQQHKKEKMFENHPVIENVVDAGTSFLSGVDRSIKDLSRGVKDFITGEETAREYTSDEIYADLIRQDAAGTKKAALAVANGIGYMGPSLVGGALGGGAVGRGMLSASAGGGAYEDAIREGKSVEDAREYAVFSGLTELATNKLLGGISAIGGGSLKNTLGRTRAGKMVADAVENGIKDPETRRYMQRGLNYLADAASEGIEEYTQELLDKGARNVIFGEDNEIRLGDRDALYSAMLGMATAGVMNLPNLAIDSSGSQQTEGQEIAESYQELPDETEVNGMVSVGDNLVDSTQTLRQMAQNLAQKQMSEENANHEAVDLKQVAHQYAEGMTRDTHYEPNNEIESINTVKVSNGLENSQQMANMKPEGNVLEGNTQPVRDIKGELGVWSEKFGENGRKVFQDSYDGETEVPGYFKGFANYYNAGRYNMEMPEANKAAASVFVSPEQAGQAYRAGVLDRNMAEVNYNPNTKMFDGMVQGQEKSGGLSYAAEMATDSQKNVASVLGKRTGLQFEIVEDMGDGIAAEYQKGTIRISANAKDFNASVSHELTHFIQDYSPDMYQIYQDHAIKAISQAEGVDIEQMFDSYIERYRTAGQELSREQAADEIVADATEKFFNDPNYIDSVIKQNRTLGEKILGFIEDMIDSLKELMKSGPSKRKAAQALESNLEDLEMARTYWMQGLQEAGDRYKSGAERKEGNTEKFELKDPESVQPEKIEENYKEVREMSPVVGLNGDEFLNGEIPLSKRIKAYYDEVGNLVHNEAVGDIVLNGRSVKDDISHGLGKLKVISFQAVPKVLEKGKILRYEENWKDRKYDSVVIGAKVKIKEGEFAGEYYELCVVKMNKETNKMYLHEVHTTKADGEPFKTRTSQETSTPSGTHPPIFSIFEKLTDVNEKREINQENKGIRYQLEEVEDHQEDTQQLIKENEKLKKANELLKKQFELTSKEELRQGDIKKVSRKILKTYSSQMKEETLSRNLTRLYEYIRSAEHVDGKELSEVASDIGRSILKQSSQMDTALTEEYKELRKQIQNTKISISEQDKQDLAAMGGYNTFRKKYFGTMKLGTDGISVDSLYQELASEHPELFDKNITHPADQLLQIGNVLDLTKPQIQNPYHANLDEMSYIVGQELLEAYYDVRQPAPTFADRKAAELMQVRNNYRSQLQSYKNTTKSNYERLLAEQRKINRELKDTHKIELLAQKTQYDEKIQKRRESLRRQEARKKILKERAKLQKWLLTPNDKQHIPEELRTTVARFLESIDFSSKDDGNGIVTQRTQDWLEAQVAFKRIIDAEGRLVDNEGNEHWVDIDPDMAGRIVELKNKVQGIQKMEDMDAYTMEELEKVVTAMRKSLTEINTMKSNTKYGETSQIAEDVFRDADKAKSKTEYGGLLGMGNKLINVDMLDPQTMFKKMGPAMESTYKALRKGLDAKTIRLREAEEYFEKAREESGISKKEIRRWTGISAETRTFEVQQYVDGQLKGTKKIELTIPQIMSLYELNKRGQARGHIYGEGIKAGDIVKGTSLDNRKIGLPVKKKGRDIRVREQDVKRITDTLTPEQKKLADALQKFMGNQISEWGNETSMEMYGYKKFTARDYFPIKTDENHIEREEGAVQNAAIKNLGFTKGTEKNARNPIVIEDIFDVFTRQVDQMSSYNAYVMPLSDLHKVLNYKDRRGFNGSSVRAELERAYGKDGVKYIEKLINDINGMEKSDNNIYSYFLSNMKASAVAGNLRVAIQQPTAIARAMAELDPKYLAMGTAKFGTKWETITKYAPIAQWKDWGFYQMQTSRQMKEIIVGSDSAKKRFVNKTMFLAEQGDKIAWKRLWNAVEYEISDKRPELEKGSEEYYKAVGDRFSEIVDKTQVADSVLHRTQIMRSKNGIVQMGTAFLAEPMKSYNMLYRAYVDNAMGTPGAKKIMARVSSAYVASAFLTAAAASAVDALRDDEKEKTWQEKYKQHFWGNFKENVNILNSLPYVKDVLSLGKGYTVKRTDVQGFEDLMKAAMEIGKYAEGDSQYTPQHLFIETTKSLSALSGIPVKNLMRDSTAIINFVCDTAGGETNYKQTKRTYAIGAEDNLGMYVEMMMDAEDVGNGKLAEEIKKDMLNAGVPEETIEDRKNYIINKTIKEEVDIEGAALNYDSQNKASKAAFQSEVEKYITLKVRAGWDEEKSLKQVRSMLTEIYKPQYLAAKTQKEKDAIIKKCKSYFYNGDSIYKDYEFARNWKKKK